MCCERLTEWICIYKLFVNIDMYQSLYPDRQQIKLGRDVAQEYAEQEVSRQHEPYRY